MSSSPLLTAMSVLLQDTIPNAIVTRITCIQDESQLVKSLTDGAIPAAKSIQLISEVDGIIIIELSKLNCHQLFHLCTMIPTLKSHFSAAEREALVELVKVMKEVYVSLKFKEENQVENLMEQLISNCATFGLDRQILQSTVDQTVENTDNHMKAQEEFIEAFELDAVLMNEVEKLRKTTETPGEYLSGNQHPFHLYFWRYFR